MAKRGPFALPVASEGALYGHMGRYAGEMVIVAAEMIGGVERLAAWADANYGEFVTKVFPKVIARPVEHNVHSDSVEALLEKLDRADNATLIEGESHAVEDRNVEEDPAVEHQD